MNLQDIFDELTYGELSQLAGGGRYDTATSVPEISEDNRPQIIRHINTSLTAIYTRFRLREKSVSVQLTPGKSTYVLDRRFAINNTASNVVLKYLVDSEDDTFDDTLLKVEQVSALRTELGLPEHPVQPYQVLALNEPNNPFSVRTPSLKTLLVPDSYGVTFTNPTTLKVDYRAQHPKIDLTVGISAPSIIDIELPATHLQALLFHVASRIMNPTGMVEEFHSGNSYYAKYEGECARLEMENIQIDSMEKNSNFQRQGFC